MTQAGLLAAIAGVPGCGESPPDADHTEQLAAVVSSATPRLVIEMDMAAGTTVPEDVRDALGVLVSELVNKPQGVDVVVDETFDGRGDDGTWSWSDIEALSRRLLDTPSTDDTVVVHVLILDGRASTGSGVTVLGLSGNHRTIGVLADEIDRKSTALSDQLGRGDAFAERLAAQAKLAVLVHEFGHVAGLVNNGVPMVSPHEAPDSPGHDVNPECIMYSTFNTAAAVDEIQGRLMNDDDAGIAFCDACRADLEAFSR